MKGWSIISNCESTVELQSVKGEALSDVLEEFAYHYQIDPIPVVNKSTVIFENIKDLLDEIKCSIENYDKDVTDLYPSLKNPSSEDELEGVVLSARQVNVTMTQYLTSISPPSDLELCDARLSALSLALSNHVLVTSNILALCQRTNWLPTYFQDSLTEIEEKIVELREYLNAGDDHLTIV